MTICREAETAEGRWGLYGGGTREGGSPGGSDSKEFAYQCRRLGLNPWVGKIPSRRKWQPMPVFHLGNPMDRGTWQVKVHGVAKSQT